MSETESSGAGQRPPPLVSNAAPGEDDDLIERIEALSVERQRLLLKAIRERWGLDKETTRE